MDDYTPTTEEVRGVYSYGALAEWEDDILILRAKAQGFDRWLASVRADAWDEGYAARPMQVVAETERGPMYSMHADNPYRSEKQ